MFELTPVLINLFKFLAKIFIKLRNTLHIIKSFQSNLHHVLDSLEKISTFVLIFLKVRNSTVFLTRYFFFFFYVFGIRSPVASFIVRVHRLPHAVKLKSSQINFPCVYTYIFHSYIFTCLFFSYNNSQDVKKYSLVDLS